MSNKAGFLFDLDGVIIDSEKEYSKLWAQVNREFPTGVTSLETVIKGCTLDKILSDHYPEEDTREKVVNRLYELERTMKYEYLPGACDLLQDLKDRELPIALVTSSNEVKMSHLKEELPELLPLFDYVVTSNLISQSKPHPEGYLLAAKNINRNPENCIVFEDSLQGVKAGRNSGAYVIGITGTLPREVLDPFADVIIDSLLEINLDSLIDIAVNR